jgi:PAS domain-containing protein
LETLSDFAAATANEIELRLATERVQQQARDRETLLESTGEGICGLDPAGRCTFINAAGARLLGYAPHEVVGRTCTS